MRRSLPAAVVLLGALAPAPATVSQTWPLPEAVAPPAGQAEAADAPGVLDERSWKLCRVELSLLLNAGGHSELLRHETRLLFHGDEIELNGDATAASGRQHALVRYAVRIRAAVARPDGVLYHVTSSARLASAVGFASEAVGRDEVRHAYLEIADPSTRLHEVFALAAPPVRLVLGVKVEPSDGRSERTSPWLEPRVPDRLHRFTVEVLLREGKSWKLMDRAQLTAGPGRPGSFTMGRLATLRRDAGDPARRLGDGVRVVDLGRLVDSGYGDDHVVEGQRADRGWHSDHEIAADDDFLAQHEVTWDDADAPRHFTVRRKRKKVSKKKAAELRRQQEITKAARAAAERSRTLPSADALPEGFRREELTLSIEPVHATDVRMQVELRLHGAVRLPGEDELTPVDLAFAEQLGFGEPFDLAVAEVVRGGEPAYDYVFRIVPSS